MGAGLTGLLDPKTAPMAGAGLSLQIAAGELSDAAGTFSGIGTALRVALGLGAAAAAGAAATMGVGTDPDNEKARAKALAENAVKLAETRKQIYDLDKGILPKNAAAEIQARVLAETKGKSRAEQQKAYNAAVQAEIASRKYNLKLTEQQLTAEVTRLNVAGALAAKAPLPEDIAKLPVWTSPIDQAMRKNAKQAPWPGKLNKDEITAAIDTKHNIIDQKPLEDTYKAIVAQIDDAVRHGKPLPDIKLPGLPEFLDNTKRALELYQRLPKGPTPWGPTPAVPAGIDQGAQPPGTVDQVKQMLQGSGQMFTGLPDPSAFETAFSAGADEVNSKVAARPCRVPDRLPPPPLRAAPALQARLTAPRPPRRSRRQQPMCTSMSRPAAVRPIRVHRNRASDAHDHRRAPNRRPRTI